jgi:hypothetical protein
MSQNDNVHDRGCRDDGRGGRISHRSPHLRKGLVRPAATHEAGQPDRTRGGGDQISELQLKNSRLRRLVTDLLLEKIELEEVGQREKSPREEKR